MIRAKPLRIRFNETDGFIRAYDGSTYLLILVLEKYDVIYNRIRYLISLKSSMTDVFSHYYAKIKVNSYDSLPLEKNVDFAQCYNTN